MLATQRGKSGVHLAGDRAGTGPIDPVGGPQRGATLRERLSDREGVPDAPELGIDQHRDFSGRRKFQVVGPGVVLVETHEVRVERKPAVREDQVGTQRPRRQRGITDDEQHPG